MSRFEPPCPGGTMSKMFPLLKCRSSVHHEQVRVCTCNTVNLFFRIFHLTQASDTVADTTLCSAGPFLRKICGCVVGFQVDPLPGGQVQPVQVSAVKIACCPSKHIQIVIYDDHRLQSENQDKPFYTPST